jgi:hypothetical protein
MSSCSFSPAFLAIDGGSGSTALSIATTSNTVARSGVVSPLDGHPAQGSGRPPVWALYPVVLGVVILILARATSERQRLAGWGLFVLMLAVSIYASGCRGIVANSSTDTHSSSQPGTPRGTYTVVVTGTAGQIRHSTNVTLTVN